MNFKILAIGLATILLLQVPVMNVEVFAQNEYKIIFQQDFQIQKGKHETEIFTFPPNEVYSLHVTSTNKKLDPIFSNFKKLTDAGIKWDEDSSINFSRLINTDKDPISIQVTFGDQNNNAGIVTLTVYSDNISNTGFLDLERKSIFPNSSVIKQGNAIKIIPTESEFIKIQYEEGSKRLLVLNLEANFDYDVIFHNLENEITKNVSELQDVSIREMIPILIYENSSGSFTLQIKNNEDNIEHFSYQIFETSIDEYKGETNLVSKNLELYEIYPGLTIDGEVLYPGVPIIEILPGQMISDDFYEKKIALYKIQLDEPKKAVGIKFFVEEGEVRDKVLPDGLSLVETSPESKFGVFSSSEKPYTWYMSVVPKNEDIPTKYKIYLSEIVDVPVQEKGIWDYLIHAKSESDLINSNPSSELIYEGQETEKEKFSYDMINYNSKPGSTKIENGKIFQRSPFVAFDYNETQKAELIGKKVLVIGELSADSSSNDLENFGHSEATSKSNIGGGYGLASHGFTQKFEVPESGKYRINFDGIVIDMKGQAKTADAAGETGFAKSDVKVLLEVRSFPYSDNVVESKMIQIAEARDPDEAWGESVEGTKWKIKKFALSFVPGVNVALFAANTVKIGSVFLGDWEKSHYGTYDFDLEFEAEKGKMYSWSVQVITIATTGNIISSYSEANASADTYFVDTVVIEPVENKVQQPTKKQTCFLWWCW